MSSVLYSMLVDASPSELSKKVNSHLSEGWRLYGDPFHSNAAGNYGFAQAVTFDSEQVSEELYDQLVDKLLKGII